MNSTDSRCQRWAKRASVGLTLGLAGERLQVARSITESDLVWDGVAGIKGRVLFDGS